MAVWWTFCSYVSARGENVVETWYDGLDDNAKAKVDTRLRYLQLQPKWERPYFDMLAGKYSRLRKFRFQSGNVQYRPLGYFSARYEFTFLFPEAQERGNKWRPRGARDIALTHLLQIGNGERSTSGFEFE